MVIVIISDDYNKFDFDEVTRVKVLLDCNLLFL